MNLYDDDKQIILFQHHHLCVSSGFVIQVRFNFSTQKPLKGRLLAGWQILRPVTCTHKLFTTKLKQCDQGGEPKQFLTCLRHVSRCRPALNNK